MNAVIEVTQDDGLWTVTLNRPDKANALTAPMLHRLADIAEEAVNARAFILTGRGKVFSAGADLADVEQGLATDPVWERLSGNIAGIKGLTIAALNGTLAGGAFGMVLACDLRIAVAQANFFYPVIKMGVAPQPSDLGRMAALIGPARTKMILLGAQKIDAARAESWGLIDQISSAESLLADAKSLATAVLAAPHPDIGAIKNVL